MRLSTAVELAGFACLVMFAHLIYGPAAWATAGVCCLLVGYAVDDSASIVAVRRVIDPIRQNVRRRREIRAAKKAPKK